MGADETMANREPIRLVVWDLDETFWRGTLTEGGVTAYVHEHHEIVVELARRGIMSSICSKNDFSAAQQILQDKGIWDYFIFPSIDWTPKGKRLRSIIEAVQLRPETVLFIDDNPSNRAEGATEVPGLQVAAESLIPNILDSPLFAGKIDASLSRLKQYKLLEQRAAAQAALGGDNTAFLRQSHVVVTIDHDVTNNIERAIELINRTNQLNFTKVRLSGDGQVARQQLLSQLEGFDVRAGLVSVRDRFGEYGFCGFFLLRGHWGHKELVHFAFSCRVLGMGIEQWVWRKLGEPKLAIVGEVVSDLSVDPDWINLSTGGLSGMQIPTSPRAVRIRGACELEVIDHFFRLGADSLMLEVVSWKDGLTMMKHHSALLRQSLESIATSLSGFLCAEA